MQSLYRFLYGGDAGAKVHAFEAPGDLNKALQILAADFRLAGIHADGRQGAKGCRAASRTGQESVTHAVERRAVLFGKADANRVGAIIENHGCSGRLALENGRSIHGYFLGSETCACGYGRIHLVSYTLTAAGIFDAVQNAHDGVAVSCHL